MAYSKKRYTSDLRSQENLNEYSSTGESDFTVESSRPLDENEILSERHYNTPLPDFATKKFVRRTKRDKQDFSGVGPKNYTKSDESLKEDICDLLWKSSIVDARDIEVKVHNGVVTLKGFVDSRKQKKRAEEAIENLPGVLDIFNELTIKSEIQKDHPFGLVDNITGLN